MLKSLMCSLVLLVAVTTQANASLIKVFFDPLSQSSPTATQVYNADGFVINRTITAGGGYTITGNQIDLSNVFGPSFVQIDYQIVSSPGATTFGELFDFYKIDARDFNGFSVDVSNYISGFAQQFQVQTTSGSVLGAAAITANGNYTVMNSTVETKISGSSTVRLYFQNLSGSFSVSNIAAVPEPTSMLMVGSAVLGLCTLRRRKVA